MKRGLGARPLLESEIIEAQKISFNASDCARRLGVNLHAFRKYARMYGLYDNCVNKNKRTHFVISPEKGKYPLSKILANEYKGTGQLRPELVIKKLWSSNIKKQRCEICDYSEGRLMDGRKPLLLCFKDGDYENYSLENLEICCYNCAHNLHTGRIGRKKTKWKKNPFFKNLENKPTENNNNETPSTGT
jgi:hypothetical protein